jgi:PhzF family phenazine biosynthesis protein
LAAPVYRYASFTDDPAAGNPAGLVLDASGMSEDEMLATAAEVGYSETAFLTPRGAGEVGVRYYSPLVEIPFCGHATIAAGVALAERGSEGEVVFQTVNGPVPVKIETDGGRITATLTSVAPSVADLDPGDLDELLEALGWTARELDPELPPRVGYAGVYHPVIAVATRERLAALDYDFDRLGRLMAARDWTTIQLVWRERADLFHARDPFPPGGLLEDPATGAAAAALGAYLRELGLVSPPATVTVHQGEDMGRHSVITVHIPADRQTIDVSGTAVEI